MLNEQSLEYQSYGFLMNNDNNTHEVVIDMINYFEFFYEHS